MRFESFEQDVARDLEETVRNEEDGQSGVVAVSGF